MVIDLHSRRIVDRSMSDSLRAGLVLGVMATALDLGDPGPGLVHHSDRGSQYASDAFQQLLGRRHITCSTSRKGDCWDNVLVESFFSAS